MYGPTAYYFATLLITMVSVLVYPFMQVSIGFWMWSYTDDSFKNYLVWCLTMLVQACVSGGLAIVLGTIFVDPI